MLLESHGNLARHPKTRRLMQRMGWTLPHAIGNLHLLWWWALEYAPTGDLTHFEPEQLTYDLDLGDVTPEQFIEAMVESGFLDRGGDNTLRIHDWPDYTAKSLRPRFRRDPERWHNVLRSYGRPVLTRRTTQRPSPCELRSSVAGGVVGMVSVPSTMVTPEPLEAVQIDSNKTSPAPEPLAPTCAEREPKMVGNALRAVPKISALDPAISNKKQHASDSVVSANDADNPQVTTILPAQAETSTSCTSSFPVDLSPIPKCLTGRRNFNGWWLKLQECYQNKGCPLTAYEQREILAMLARNPFAAVEKLQYSVVNFETSYATFLAPQKRQQENST